ncbi:hypothetical protein BDW74DRAFT_184775 [Aspergillus multicolor]|uniref:MFS transporter n=1 Tax=Aspergillus multicolor TaxID=41759 RepID=UPI003CCCBA01
MTFAEIFRDTVFGKTIQFLSRNRLLRFPKEKEPSKLNTYVKNPHVLKREESLTSDSDEDLETYGLYSLMSQAPRSRSGRDPALIARTRTEDGGPLRIITWAPDDSEFLVSSEIYLLAFSIDIGSAIYTPGIPDAVSHFGISTVAASLELTVFVLGYSLGPMILSSLSELPAIGRSPTYVVSLLIFVFLNFAVIYTSNLAMFPAFRFLAGFFGSPALATGGASMGDICSPRIRDSMIAIWGAFVISAPVLGPLVGGFAVAAEGWTWTIWQLIWVSGVTIVLLFFLLSETYAPTILSHLAQRIRKITGDANCVAEAELEVRSISSKNILFEALIRPFQLSFLEPIILLLNLYIALIYGILYIRFEAFPIIFEEKHGFNPSQTGLTFLGKLIGTIALAISSYFYWKYTYQARMFDANGNITPEAQLPPACVGCICLPISLFWFGWTGNFTSIHWLTPIITSGLLAIGGCLIFNNIFTYQAHAYPRYAAYVLAGNGFMRSSFGAGFPLLTTAMFHNLARVRMASRFARHDI